MKDIAEKVDALRKAATEGHDWDAEAQMKSIIIDFFGEVVANSRRIAVSLERIADLLEVTNAEDGKVITLPQILLRMAKNSEPVKLEMATAELKPFEISPELWESIKQLAWECGQDFSRGQRAG